MESLPPELLNHIASYLPPGPHGTLPSLAATSRPLRFAAENLTFRRVRIRTSNSRLNRKRDFETFEQVFRKEEGWRRGVVREVRFEVEIGSGEAGGGDGQEVDRDRDSEVFTQGVGRLLCILREWELDGSGASWDEASGAGGIKLTINSLYPQHDDRLVYRRGRGELEFDFMNSKMLRLLVKEGEIKKTLPRVWRIVGLDITSSSCRSRTIEPASVATLAGRMPALRNWAMALPASTSIIRLGRDSDEALRTRMDFAQTLRVLCSSSKTTTFNHLTTFTLSSLSKFTNTLSTPSLHYSHSLPQPSSQKEKAGEGEGRKDLLSQALNALSRLPNLEQFCLLAPVGLSSEIFWPLGSTGGGDGSPEEEEEVQMGEKYLWPKLQVLKVMFAARKPGGGWYPTSPVPRHLLTGVSVRYQQVVSPASVESEHDYEENRDGGVEQGVASSRGGMGMGHTSTGRDGEEGDVQMDYNYSDPLLQPNYIHPPMSLDYPPTESTNINSQIYFLPTELINLGPVSAKQTSYPKSRATHAPIYILLDPSEPNPVITTSLTSLDSPSPGNPFHTIINPDTFTPVLTALGKAVSRMPKLKSAELAVDVDGWAGSEVIFKLLGVGEGVVGGWDGSIGRVGGGGMGRRGREQESTSRWLVRVGSGREKVEGPMWDELGGDCLGQMMMGWVNWVHSMGG